MNQDNQSEYIRFEDDIDDAISIEDGYFKWESNDNYPTRKRSKSCHKSEEKMQSEINEFYLQSINLRISKGSFVAIVGSVGSGKSSLLSALLGEMECVRGHVRISSTHADTAYVAQQAWIQNTSLKNNILFGSSYNSIKYERVVHACALGLDISYLPGGDETEIGEKGINLSGGQKQRVSLARACYTEADVYFLDDPLSAVDAHVAKHLFDNVLSSKTGILRSKTRILVTSRLGLLPLVDNIIVLDNGRISEMGTYEDLKSSENEFSELMEQLETSFGGDDSEEEIIQPGGSKELSPQMSFTVPHKDGWSKKLTKAEKIETESISWNVYSEYLKRASITWLLALIISQIATTGMSMSSNIWLSEWSSSGKNLSQERASFFLKIYVLLGILQGKESRNRLESRII